MARNYRVATGPENTGLGGSSLGALIALYTVAVRPGVIGRLLLESPSLWASNRQLIRQSRGVKRWPERVFLATGTAEAGRKDKDQSMVDDVRELAAILRRAGLDDARLKLVVDEGASHHESAWARRFPGCADILVREAVIGFVLSSGLLMMLSQLSGRCRAAMPPREMLQIKTDVAAIAITES